MRVNVVTPWNILCGNADYAKGLVKEQKKLCDVHVVEIRKPHTKNPLYFIRLAQRAGRGCDIVHIHHGYGVFGKLLLSGVFTPLFYIVINREKKVVTTLHDVYAISGFRGMTRKLMNYFMFKRSDVLHVHTHTAATLLEKQGVPRRKILVAPLAIFQKPVRLNKRACKKRFGLKGTVMLLFGFIQRNKGHDIAIRALSRLNGASLLIAGSPYDRRYCEELKHLAQQLGVENRVVFTGKFCQSDIPAIMGAADVGLLPYRKLTQSSVLSFFMAYGIPVVASDLPFFREVRDCIAISRTEDGIAAHVRDIMRHAHIRKEMKQNMAHYVAEQSAGRIAQRTQNLYNHLLAEGL